MLWILLRGRCLDCICLFIGLFGEGVRECGNFEDLIGVKVAGEVWRMFPVG